MSFLSDPGFLFYGAHNSGRRIHPCHRERHGEHNVMRCSDSKTLNPGRPGSCEGLALKLPLPCGWHALKANQIRSECQLIDGCLSFLLRNLDKPITLAWIWIWIFHFNTIQVRDRMTEKLYGDSDLKHGDKDLPENRSNKNAISKGYVKKLQNDLKILGIFFSTIDGDFGAKTKQAVEMFQWNAKKIKKRIKNNSIVNDPPVYTGSITGVVNQTTKKEITRWLEKSFKATGDLTRIKESQFSNIEIGSAFRKIKHLHINDGEIVISGEIIKYLKYANSKAKNLALNIVINQAMRVSGQKVTGAVVPPAKKSQHLIGHAIDCNIVDGDNWNNSRTFENGKETKNAKTFIAAMKKEGLRWGGDFTNIDTPHFDKQIISVDYKYKYFFNQRTISENQKIPLTTW